MRMLATLQGDESLVYTGCEAAADGREQQIESDAGGVESSKCKVY
jgi:hypothetical protein